MICQSPYYYCKIYCYIVARGTNPPKNSILIDAALQAGQINFLLYLFIWFTGH